MNWGNGITAVYIQKRADVKWTSALVLYLLEGKILLLAVAVAVEELINTTCGINELVLASVEWVAGRGDFKLYEWVLNAVDLDGLLGADG